MNDEHLSLLERHQIRGLMKAQHNITQIAELRGPDMSNISRELRLEAGCSGYQAV
jgi:IS30 family transposase